MQENPCKSAERAILTKFQAPNFEISEPEKMQFHTPSHSIPPLDSLLVDLSGARIPRLYAPARNDYIHKLLFSEFISEKLHFGYQKYFGELNFPKTTLHVFICDLQRTTCGNSLLGKSHFSYTKEYVWK